MSRLLLVSTSTTYGTGYLDHCEREMLDLLGTARRLLFVPYALHDRDAYAARVRERFARSGLEVDSVHEAVAPLAAVNAAEAIFIGGGNTFRLLDQLYARHLMEALRERALAGIPYLGTSAGSNVAGLTIKTTNDMPIVDPPSLDALALVPFNLNPHYLDPDPASRHMGESRETRIREFHEENDAAVVGLREGGMIRVEGACITLRGEAGARIFRKGQEPLELKAGASLAFLGNPA